MEDLERYFDLIHAKAGYRAVCTRSGGGGVKHHWGLSTRELLDLYTPILGQTDIYHTCHTYRVAHRNKKSVELYKCIPMDIDIRKPGEAKQAKGFETIEELLERLLIDIEPHYAQKLHINYSGGGGVHAFVPFAEPVDYKTFYSAARQLVAHTKNVLGFDSSCTMNPVGILRVPGSINSKKKKAVEVLQWGEAFHRPKYVNGTSLEGEKKEQDYLDRRYASVTLADLVDTCGHIRQLAAGWNDQPYESWLGCATVLKRVEGGVGAFHEWSKQSVQWESEEVTQAKID